MTLSRTTEDQARLDWRYVTDPCEVCGGRGARPYNTSATWRGGAAVPGHSIDVCDRCWGTGDRFRRGVNLRVMRDEERVRVAELAVSAIAEAAGATIDICRAQILELVRELRALETRRRRPPLQDDIRFTPLVRSLADLLERATQAPREIASRHRRSQW